MFGMVNVNKFKNLMFSYGIPLFKSILMAINSWYIKCYKKSLRK